MYIAYFRVKKPKSPNFDLTQQREAVRSFRPKEEFIETEKAGSRDCARQTLQTAIERAKELGAVLVIAKLDRLVRNAWVTQALQASGIEFLCVDQPNTNHKTIHILAALADDETYARSQRMKDTYAQQKANGRQLGSSNPALWKGREHKRGTLKAQKVAAVKRREGAYNRYQYLMPTIKEMRENGKDLEEIRVWLNNNGHLTTAMKPFTQTAVWRIIKRYLGDKYLGHILSKDHKLAQTIIEKTGVTFAIRRRERIAAHYGELLPIIEGMRNEGKSVKTIVLWLNTHHYTTPKGKEFAAGNIYSLLQRLSIEELE